MNKFVKLAELEDELETVFDRDTLADARGRLSAAEAKSFAIRHPWITGIPTLGIWPAVAHQNAYSKVIRQMARDNPNVRKMLLDKRKRDEHRAVRDERMSIERDRANALPNTVREAAKAYSQYANSPPTSLLG